MSIIIGSIHGPDAGVVCLPMKSKLLIEDFASSYPHPVIFSHPSFIVRFSSVGRISSFSGRGMKMKDE